MPNKTIQNFESFLQTNKPILDKRIASYIKSNDLADVGRIFNELPVYPGINQAMIVNFHLALEFNQLDRWYQYVMNHVLRELFDEQGEIIEPIKKIFATAGMDSNLFTQNEFKKSLISSYFTNILGPVTGKLAKEKKVLMEQEGSLTLDNPQDDPIFKDQKASSSIVLTLDKIDGSFIQSITDTAPEIQAKANYKYAEALLKQWIAGEDINSHLEKFNFDQLESLREQIQEALDNHKYPESIENLTVFSTELITLKKFKLFVFILNEDDYPDHCRRFIKEELSVKELDNLISELKKTQKKLSDTAIQERIALELPLLQAMLVVKKAAKKVEHINLSDKSLDKTSDEFKRAVAKINQTWNKKYSDATDTTQMPETKVKFKDDIKFEKTISREKNAEFTEEEAIQGITAGQVALKTQPIKSNLRVNNALPKDISKKLEVSTGMFGKGFFGRLKSYIKAHPIKSLLIGAALVVGVSAFIAGCVFSGGTLAAATGLAGTFGGIGLSGIGIVGGAALTGIGIGALGYQTKKHAIQVNAEADINQITTKKEPTEATINSSKKAIEYFHDLLNQLHLSDNKKIIYQNNQLKIAPTNTFGIGKQGVSKETVEAFSKSLDLLEEMSKQDLFSARDHLYQLRSTHWAEVVLPNNPQLYERFVQIENQQIKQIAQELFAVNRADFLKISDSELLDPSSYNKTENSPNLANNSKHFNQISSLVISDILKNTELSACTQRVAFWIEIASQCREQGNFAGMQAVMAGLGYSAVSRLLQQPANNSPSVVMRGLPEILQNKYYQLQTLINPTGSYKNLREATQTQSGPVVPYLGIYQSDLTFAKDGEPDENKLLAETIGGQKTLVAINTARSSLTDDALTVTATHVALDKVPVMDKAFDQAKLAISRQIVEREKLKTKDASSVLLNFSSLKKENKAAENLFKTDIAAHPTIDLATAETIYQSRYQLLLASQYKTTATEIDQFYQQHKTVLDNVKNLDLSIEEKRAQITPIYSDLRQQRAKLDQAIAAVTVQRQTIDQEKGELKKQIEFLTLHLADSRPMLQEMLRFYSEAKMKAVAASRELVEEGDKAVIYLEKFLGKFDENKPIYLSDLSKGKFEPFYSAIDNLRQLINAVANIDEQIKNEHNAIVTGQYMPVINAYFSKQQTLEALPEELQAKINKKEKNIPALLQELDAKKPALKEIEAQALIERTYSDFMSDMSVNLQAAERLLDNELINGISLERLAIRAKDDPRLIAGLNWEKFAQQYDLLSPIDGTVDLKILIELNPTQTISIQLHSELTKQLQAMNQALHLSIADTMAINEAFDQLKNNKISTNEFIKLFKEKTKLENLSNAFTASLPVSIVRKIVNTEQPSMASFQYVPEPVTPNDEPVLDEPAPQMPQISSVVKQETTINLAEHTDDIEQTANIDSQFELDKQATNLSPENASAVATDIHAVKVDTAKDKFEILIADNDEIESNNDIGYDPEPVSPELIEIQEKLTAIDIQQRILDAQKNASLRISQKTMQTMNQRKALITLDEFLEICNTLEKYDAVLEALPSTRAGMEILIKNAAKYFFEKLATEIKAIELNPTDHLTAENLNACIKTYEKIKTATNTLPVCLNLQHELQSLTKFGTQIDALASHEKLQKNTELKVATATFNPDTPHTLLTVQLPNTPLTYTRTQDGRFGDYKRPRNYSLSTDKDIRRGYTDEEKTIIKDMMDNALKTGETQFNLHGDNALCRKAARNLLVALPEANIFINNASKAYQPDLKERIEISSKRKEFKAEERAKLKPALQTPPTNGGSAA